MQQTRNPMAAGMKLESAGNECYYGKTRSITFVYELIY
jgi:hypothetical protein